MTAFDDALAFIWRPENDGQGFHNDPRDPGGATSWGVTFATWSGWQRLHGVSAPTLEAFKAVVPDDLAPLYGALFWNACQCDALAAGVGLMVFDAAVGSGPGNAARWLQTAVGVPIDGRIGPVTLGAARSLGPARLINRLAHAREAFYASLPTFPIYGRGWDRRCQDCRIEALRLAGGPAPAGGFPDDPVAASDGNEADTLNAAELARDAP